jgi:hypothetical protein
MEASFIISCIMIISIIILYMREYKRQYNSQYFYDFIKTFRSISNTVLIKKESTLVESTLIESQIISINIKFTFFNYLNKNLKNKL